MHQNLVRPLLVLACCAALFAEQSDNHVINAVPVPGAVVVDGALSEWDLSGGIPICRDVLTQMGSYSATVAMMYDADALYVGVDWFDPTPMMNNYDPRFDVDLRHCFHSDSIQLHFKTDIERKVIGWRFTKGGVPGVCVLDGWFPWDDSKPIPYIDGIAKLGIAEAFTLKPDGKGYVQEMRIPWTAMVASGTAYVAGQEFACMLDLVWGPESGKGWPVNHLMDLVEPGANHAGWFWEVRPIYGKVALSPVGHLDLPVPAFIANAKDNRQHQQLTAGPVALPYTMPFDGFATVVVEDAQGRRVKNLVGMAPRGPGEQAEHWDCTDEAGNIVAEGTYRYRGLLHQGIDPTYAATYGTPGSPPWDSADGTGAWLSDHCAPRAAAAGGNDMLVFGAERAESGCALIGIGADGRKRWGDSGLVGVYALAADAEYAYVLLNSWDTPAALSRVMLADGRYAPYATAEGSRLKVPVFAAGEKAEWIPGFALAGDRLAVAIAGEPGRIRFFDRATAAVVGELTVPGLGCLAADADGVLHVWSAGTIAKLVDGALVPVITTGLPTWAEAMAIDVAGRFFLAVRATQQVKVYAKDGTFLRDIGSAGGRQAVGAWQADGLMNPMAIAIDGQGRLWVTEEDGTPKRISVWTADGAFVTDFIGPTGYGGTGANADPDDASRVFGSGCEFALDQRANRAQVVARLGPVDGQLMKIDGREYVMNKGGRLYRRNGDAMRLVAAMGNVGVKDLGGVADIPLPPAPEGTHGYASISFVWSDRDDDGTPDADEVVNGSMWSGWEALKYPVGVTGYFGSYWLDAAFNLYGVAGESHGAYGGRPPMVSKIPLKGWTAGGAPIWDIAKQQLLSDGGKVQGCLFLPSDGQVIVGLTAIGDDGVVRWSYRDQWHGVHDSHHAPLPDNDAQLIGTLGCIGHARTQLGTVFAMHSNMGRLHLMTTDGLFVASVFKDCRLGGDAWPTTARLGAPLRGVTMGSEWFGGHFFKAEKTGEYFLIAGFTAYNLITLNGFDTLQAIPGGTVTVGGAELREAETIGRSRALKQSVPADLTIATAATPPVIDGRLDEVAKDSFVAWSAGPYQIRAALAADAAKLYLAYDVSGDDNPMVNAGQDVNQLFATGDSVDLQVGTDADADPGRGEAAIGDLRLLISVHAGKPVAVLYRWKVEHDPRPVTFTCPWRSHTVDRVEVLAEAEIAIERRNGGYAVEAAVPLAVFGFAPQAGKAYRLDLGVIFSDAKGTNRAARIYWANKATGLTADVPGEIMATPNLWGRAMLAR